MSRTKPCTTCGDPMTKFTRFAACTDCRRRHASAGTCSTLGCEKATSSPRAAYCDGCTTARRLHGPMADLAELRPLMQRWNAVARSQVQRGPARLWR